MQTQQIKFKDYSLIIQHVVNNKLPFNIKKYFSYKDINRILNFMIKDKKNVSKKINLILLKKIGSTVINNEYSYLKVKQFLVKKLVN